MTTNEFKEYVKTRKALDTEEIHRFMDDMSNESRRITFRLNTAYHTPDEVRGLLSPSYSVIECRHRCGYFHRSMPISVRISLSVKVYSLMPAVIFKIMAV